MARACGRVRTSTTGPIGRLVPSTTRGEAPRRHSPYGTAATLSTHERRRRALPAVTPLVTRAHASANGARWCRPWTFDTVAMLGARARPRHAARARFRRLSRGVSRSRLLVTRDDPQRFEVSPRRVNATGRCAVRHDEFPHDEPGWFHVRLGVRTRTFPKRSLAHERVPSNSRTVERWEEIFGLEGLDEREDSMRARASLPFGPPSGAERRAPFMTPRPTCAAARPAPSRTRRSLGDQPALADGGDRSNVRGAVVSRRQFLRDSRR